MENYIIVSEKPWNASLLESLKNKITANWTFIDNKDEFLLDNLISLNPKYIFVPHWSYFIPEEIYSKFNCIVFHETDLPFGRGGSPIQNLIERGFDTTKVTALKAVKEFDSGPIYLKKDLALYGTAEEIYLRINQIVEEMIIEIINKNIIPIPQEGEPVIFKRRNPEQSNISELKDIEKVFDYIRMLDANGYPKAFIETKSLKFEFSRASLKSNNSIVADVRIIKK